MARFDMESIVDAETMKVLVATEIEGHYAEYLRHLLRYGSDFTFLGSEALWKRAAAGLDLAGRDIIFKPLDLISRTTYRETLVAVLNLVPDVTVITLLGGERLRLLSYRDWRILGLQRVPMRGILYSLSFYHDRRFSFWCFFKFCERTLKIYLVGLLYGMSYYTHDTALIRFYKRLSRLPGYVPLRPLPDPMNGFDCPPTLSTSGDYLLMIGYHGPRKGTLWALDAMEEAGLKVRVVIAGASESGYFDSARQRIYQNINLTWREGTLDEAQFTTLIREARMVLLPYLHWGGSSGILLHAMRLGKRVVLPRYGKMAVLFDLYGYGRTYPMGSKSGFIQATQQQLSDQSPPPCLSCDAWEKLAIYTDPMAFVDCILGEFDDPHTI